MKASVPGSTAIDAGLVERFKQALDRLNPDGGKIGLAVSGGPDSMAMLLLAQEAIPGGFEVATVDHGLRPEAKDECALVVAACEERGVLCEELMVDVPDGNLQAMARQARYFALAEWAKMRSLKFLATAHHIDDQAETFLMRLNRGSGLKGLAGVREKGWIPGRLMQCIRPLLTFRRDELLAIVRQAGTAFASDPSNQDASFGRVAMRNALDEAPWLDVEAIAASAGHLADAEAALGECATRLRDVHCYAARGEYEIQEARTLPRIFQMLFVEDGIAELGGAARGGQVSNLVDRLLKGEGGNLTGVLATVKGESWVFRPEPPRKTG